MTNTSEKKYVLITGACGTLGQRIAHEKAGPNTHLILIDRNPRSLEKLDDALTESGTTTTLVPLDFMQSDLLDQLAAPLLEKTSVLHAVFSCHGVMHALKPGHLLSPKEWHETLTVNLTSNYYLVRLVYPFLKKAPTSSLSFYTCPMTDGYDSAYAASKAGLGAFIKTLQTEEPSSSGLNIHWIEEPPFDSPLRRKAFPNGDPRIHSAKEAC